MNSPSWGPASSKPPAAGPLSDSPPTVENKPQSKDAIAGPGRCLFAVVVPPKDLEPEDVRCETFDE
jgi:hypothetical protein